MCIRDRYNYNNNFYIGGIGGYVFNGLIDEVKIYNYALTEDEVKAEYNQSKTAVMGTTKNTASTWDDGGFGGAAPIAEWNFEENTGATAYDSSGNGNNGTITGATWNVGKIGGALSFDGDGDYIDVPGTFQPSPYVTIEYWVQLDDTLPGSCSPESWETVVFKSNSFYDEFLCSNGAFYFRPTVSGTRVDDTYFTQTWTAGKWYHIAEVFDGTYAKVYVNGIQKISKSHSGSLSTNSNVLKIGYFSSGVQDLDGKIDQVRVFNYARTPAQIAWDYNHGAPIAHWRFDEGQGATLYDSSGNGNNGTLTLGSSGQTSAGSVKVNANTAWYNGREGKQNYSLNFDGTDDYVNVGTTISSALGTGDLTLSAWFKTSTSGVILNNYSGTPMFILGVDPKGYFTLRGGDGIYHKISTTFYVNNNQWHHLVGVRSGDTQYIYLDGTIQDSASGVSGLNINSSCATVIGAQNGYPCVVGGTNKFSGQIDDVRIYNYALTADQVKAVYNFGAAHLGTGD